MCCIQDDVQGLDPTFLFVWTGVRRKDEPTYHSHEHIELDFIRSGNGRYYIDGKFYEVTEGDLIILNPGVKHRSLVSDKDNPANEFFIGLTDLIFKDKIENQIPLPEGKCVIHTAGKFRQRIYSICKAMETENAICQVGKYQMLKSYLIQLLVLMLREQTDVETKQQGCAFDSTNKKYVVNQIIKYFEEHYSEKISLDRIAENMYISPFYISKIFKSETGEAPIRHLIDIRLEKAKELLESDVTQSIQSIAAQVGYEDAYHFSKLFKKKYGVAPSKLRA